MRATAGFRVASFEAAPLDPPHGATTSGADRTDEHFLTVPGSGTGALASIRGSGGIAVDGEGRHETWFHDELG